MFSFIVMISKFPNFIFKSVKTIFIYAPETPYSSSYPSIHVPMSVEKNV